MPSMHTAETRSEHLAQSEAGRQRQGRLWSTLQEVCELLRVAAAVPANTEELLFQHVQFKTGQRVHTVPRRRGSATQGR